MRHILRVGLLALVSVSCPIIPIYTDSTNLQSKNDMPSERSVPETLVEELEKVDAQVEGYKKQLAMKRKEEEGSSSASLSFDKWVREAKRHADPEIRKLAMSYEQTVRLRSLLVQNLVDAQTKVP